MAKKKELKEQIREILAEDFVGPPSPFQAAMSKSKADWIKNPPGLDSELVGPPLPERRMAGPFAADYVNAPPGYEPAPTEPLSWIDRELYNKGIAPFVHRPKNHLASIDLRQQAHPAGHYYGKHQWPGYPPAMGSRSFHPGYEQVPEGLSDEFYPPPTISNEEQEMIDAERGALAGAIRRALKESKKKDK